MNFPFGAAVVPFPFVSLRSAFGCRPDRETKQEWPRHQRALFVSSVCLCACVSAKDGGSLALRGSIYCSEGKECVTSAWDTLVEPQTAVAFTLPASLFPPVCDAIFTSVLFLRICTCFVCVGASTNPADCFLGDPLHRPPLCCCRTSRFAN